MNPNKAASRGVTRPAVSPAKIFLICLSSLVLTAMMAMSQTNIVLEGFENGVGAISVFTAFGGRSAAGKVQVNLYTATGTNDQNVTEGSHSAAVSIGGTPGFGNDLMISLSDDASALVQAAVFSNQVARYILRYDLIFKNPAQYSYFNHHAFIGNDWDYTVLSAADKNGHLTFSCALDLNNLNLPTSGSITWRIADDFGTVATWVNNSSTITFYIDNIRLVDTYAAGATPVTYLLQSFEDTNNPVGGATNYTGLDNGMPIQRTTYANYTLDGGPLDIAVTDGQHALQVSNNNPNPYHADFKLPLTGTKLADVLQLNAPASQRPTRTQLAHYTLRWDVTMPGVLQDSDFINQLYYTGTGYLPMAMGRQEYINLTGPQSLTYSVTLDQIASWGNLGANPGLVFIDQGPPDPMSVIFYYDNFRLIDTAPPGPTIQSYQYDSTNNQFTLTWSSSPTATYSVLESPTLGPALFGLVATNIASGGTQTTATVPVPAGTNAFLEITSP